MRILGRKFYAYKSKNRRKNTPDSAFPRTLCPSVSLSVSGVSNLHLKGNASHHNFLIIRPILKSLASK